jgi:hypothetical protein
MFLVLRVNDIDEEDVMSIEPVSMALDEQDADSAVIKDAKVSSAKLYLFVESSSSQIFDLKKLNDNWKRKKKSAK